MSILSPMDSPILSRLSPRFAGDPRRRRRLRRASLGLALTVAALAGCSSASPAEPSDGGASTPTEAGAPDAAPAGPRIEHVVVVIQENHTFDNYFGRYCTAPAGSNPTCNDGPACCEAVPATEPSGASPVVLDDTSHASFDPDHTAECEVAEINGGKMDKFVTGTPCARPQNFAVADPATMKTYHDYAKGFAIADRYFQPVVGQSSSNDMYFAVAKYVFGDNAVSPNSVGKACNSTKPERYEGQKTLADVLTAAKKTVGFYAEGWDAAKAAGNSCMPAPADCPLHLPTYPCVFDPSDIPFLYYGQHVDDSAFMRDFSRLQADVAGNTLPDVAFVKAFGFRSEHPGYGTTLSAGIAFTDGVIKSILASPTYKDNTLVLVAWDEGGGYFDHVPPPATSAVDQRPYGTRLPLLAIGRFARKGFVSHVTMEHSSIVKFLEWNFTGATGQLGARDAVVNNIGSLLDPTTVAVPVPSN